MRIILVFTFFVTLVSPVFGQLTEQTIRQIIREELEPVKLDVAEMKGKMATKDDLINMRKDFSEELKSVKLDVTEVKLDLKEMKGKIEGLEGKMATKDNIITVRDEVHSLYRWIIAMWITIFLAVFGIPYLYGRADREKVKKLEADVRELNKLRAEVEALKAIKEAEDRRRETAKKIAEEKPEFEEAYRVVGLL